MIRVTTPATATPSFWTSDQITTTIRPRLAGATAADDARLLEMAQEITREGEQLASGSPGSLWYQGYAERVQFANPTTNLYLEATPVDSITSVSFDGSDPLAEGVEPQDFTIYPWGLYRQDGWDTGSPGWSIVYSGGYWLASMGTSPPAGLASFVDGTTGHDRRALHLRRAAESSLQAVWARDKDGDDPMIVAASADGGSFRRESGASSGGLLTPSATAAFLREGISRRNP